MEIKSVFDPSFRAYGRVLEGYDFTELCEKMMETPCPADGTIYVPGDPAVEAAAIYNDFTNREYGGLPVQVGYCNGYNKTMNAMEYHRSSEVNVAVGNDAILLIGKQADVEPDFTYDSSKAEAFLLPAGVGVEVFATTLHYAPICPAGVPGFRVVVVLPLGTNTDLEVLPQGSPEDKLITAKNKWLIAHPEAGIAGAFCGIKGDNITFD